MPYVYRFIDIDDNIIYVGKSENLELRMKQHFEWHQTLSEEMYQRVKRVDYLELDSDSDMHIKELYYINKYRPVCNIKDKGVEQTNVQLDEKFDVWLIYQPFLVTLVDKLQKENRRLELLVKSSSVSATSCVVGYGATNCKGRVVASYSDEVQHLEHQIKMSPDKVLIDKLVRRLSDEEFTVLALKYYRDCDMGSNTFEYIKQTIPEIKSKR